MRALCLRAALATVLVASSAAAQSLTITESQALAELGHASPRVQALRAAVEVTRADVLAAARWPNPEVTFNREAVAGIAEDMVTVSQALAVTGRRGLAVRAASARVEASASRADDQVRRLRADLRLAFAQLVTAQARERELARARDRLHALAEVLGRREVAGEAAGFDRLRAARDVLDLDADHAAAATSRARAQAVLSAFLNAPADPTAVEAIHEARPREALPPLDHLMAHAEKTRGVLAALQWELQAASLAERSAVRSRVPEPALIAGTKSSNVGTGDIGTIVSVRVAVPLFDRAGPERAAAHARAAQARLDAEAFRLTLRAQLAAWRAAVLERREIADRYRAASADADRVERIAQISYEAGERGILELLDAYRTGAAARLRQVELDAAVREAEIELEFASGWEMP